MMTVECGRDEWQDHNGETKTTAKTNGKMKTTDRRIRWKRPDEREDTGIADGRERTKRIEILGIGFSEK